MRELPPLNLLTTFEAAARHLSFTRAAAELNVLQPAISRQIASLEADLGSTLFIRTKPTLTLTSDGEALYASVASGIEQIRRAVLTIRERRQRETLVVNTTIGFASCFLMTRLACFRTTFPDYELELVTRDQNRAFDSRLSDVVILFGDSGFPGTESSKVFSEVLVAVCRPTFLPDGQMLPLAQLIEQPLLFLSDAYHIADWDRFLGGTGYSVSPPPQPNRFKSYMVYLHAVLNGDGVGVTLDRLAADDIAAGRLRLASDRRVPTERGYHCCILEGGRDKPAAKAFLEWASSQNDFGEGGSR